MNRLIKTVDNTIEYLKGKQELSSKQLFEAFSDEQQAEYEREVMQKYEPAIVRASVKKWKAYTAEEKQRIGEEGNALYLDILRCMPKGVASPEAQSCVDRWRRHIEYFWIPNDEQLIGLVDLYNEDARFKFAFDKIAPRLADFMQLMRELIDSECV